MDNFTNQQKDFLYLCLLLLVYLSFAVFVILAQARERARVEDTGHPE